MDEKPPGTYDICDLCGWEDDAVQFAEPDYEGGANGESLREAQHRFLLESTNRNYSSELEKDESWKILSPPNERTRTTNVETNYVCDRDGVIYKK